MRRILESTGTYPHRLWFETGVIDKIMQYHLAIFLNELSPKTFPPIPIEKFLESYVSSFLGREVNFDPYSDVEAEEGPGVLGATAFYPDRVDVKIDKKLTEKADQSIDLRGRYNITVAHEASHCLLHSQIFTEQLHPLAVLSSSVKERLDLTESSWLEFQANQGMGALMMPKAYFVWWFTRERNAYGIYDNADLQSDKHIFDAVVGNLSRTFEVSRQAVRVRLSHLNLIPYDVPPEKESSSESGFEQFGAILSNAFRQSLS